jgi:hypothetical protein
MTKKEIIEFIRNAEDKAYKDFTKVRNENGEEHDLTHSYFCEWTTLYWLCDELGIERVED